MEDYVRYGKYILPVCIYQCECWESVNVAGKGKSFIIPFCSSVEVGVRANSDRFKRMMIFKEEEQLRRIQGKNRRTRQYQLQPNRHISVLQKVPRIKATIIRNYLVHYQTKKSWFQMNF